MAPDTFLKSGNHPKANKPRFSLVLSPAITSPDFYSMEPTIMRHEALKIIDSGQSFDLVFITADRRRGTGGEVKRVVGWQKISDSEAPGRLPGQFAKKTALVKDPRHGQHKTINIYNPNRPAEHPMKVHWRLMIYMNGKMILQ